MVEVEDEGDEDEGDEDEGDEDDGDEAGAVSVGEEKVCRTAVWSASLREGSPKSRSTQSPVYSLKNDL